MRPICLPFEDSKSKSYEGEEVRVIGWGFITPQVPREENGKYTFVPYLFKDYTIQIFILILSIDLLLITFSYWLVYLEMANILQVVRLKVIKIDICQAEYKSKTKIYPESQFCAGGDENKDSCNGDSGGSVVKYNAQEGKYPYTIVGLVSYGPEFCGTPNRHGVYTKVRAYTDWILENLRKGFN